MKLNIRAFAVLTVISIYMPSWAAYETVGNIRYYYTVSNGEAILGDGQDCGKSIEYKTSSGSWTRGVPSGISSLTIPSTFGGYPVVKISSFAFQKPDIPNLNNIKQIILPASLKTIGSYAFWECSFSSLSIPGSVTSIGQYAFYVCGNLSTLTFEESTKSLSLGNKALITKPSDYTPYGPATIIFHRNAPSSIGTGATPDTTKTTVWVRPNSTGWGVSIPGKWKGASIKYLKSVNFDANGGSVVAATRWRTDGAKVGTLPTPTHPEATFNGWFTAKSGGTQISDSTTVSANKIFYAQWTLNKYTASFDLNGGEGDAPSRTQNWGTEIGALPEPTRTGYFFKGWFTESEGGSQIGATDKIECDKTYFAHWERDPIPEMVSGETVAEVLAGAADETLAAKLGTTRNYKNYRGWVDDKALEHKAVKESPNAWLAYALDAPGLIAKPSAVAKEDFIFETGSSVAEEPGKMAFDFGIDGVTIGEEAELDEVFVITGAATLEESAFTESGVTATLERTSDGKVSVAVEPPKDGSGNIPDAYFFRVKLK